MKKNTVPHVHTYDAQGRMTCCTLEEKIQVKSGPPQLQPHSDDDGHDHDHEGELAHSPWREYLPAIISFALLLAGIALEYLSAMKPYCSARGAETDSFLCMPP